MKKILFILSVIIFNFFYSCVLPFDRAYSLRIQNNTDKIIGFTVSENYPDTLIYNNYNELCGIKENSYVTYDVKTKLDEYFENLPSDTLSIFFFSMDTINQYGWDIVKKEYKILKRYDISYEDVKNSEWTVSYP